MLDELTARSCGIRSIKGLEQQNKSQTATADVHQFHEMTDTTAGIALARENARMEGENGAGLEIAATVIDEMVSEMAVGLRIEREAPVVSATKIDEVGETPKPDFALLKN